jgi:hypothetical protein
MCMSSFVFIQVGGLLQQWVGLGQPIIIRVCASICVTIHIYHLHSHPPLDLWLVQQCAKPCTPPHTLHVDVLRLCKRQPCCHRWVVYTSPLEVLLLSHLSSRRSRILQWMVTTCNQRRAYELSQRMDEDTLAHVCWSCPVRGSESLGR